MIDKLMLVNGEYYSMFNEYMYVHVIQLHA